MRGSKARACTSPRPPQMCVQCHVTISAFKGFSLTSDALQRCCLHHGRGELIWMPKSKKETFGGEDDHWDNELAKFCKLNVNRLCYCPALHGVNWLQLLSYRSVAKTPRFQISCAQSIHKWSGLLSKYSTWATSLSKPKWKDKRMKQKRYENVWNMHQQGRIAWLARVWMGS